MVCGSLRGRLAAISSQVSRHGGSCCRSLVACVAKVCASRAARWSVSLVSSLERLAFIQASCAIWTAVRLRVVISWVICLWISAVENRKRVREVEPVPSSVALGGVEGCNLLSASCFFLLLFCLLFVRVLRGLM